MHVIFCIKALIEKMHKNRSKLQNVEYKALSNHYLVSISSIIILNLSALGLRKGYNGVSNIELQALEGI